MEDKPTYYEYKIGDAVLAIVQINYSMEEVVGTIISIGPSSYLEGDYYLLDCGEFQHSIFKRAILGFCPNSH